jgi:hypothetical protein
MARRAFWLAIPLMLAAAPTSAQGSPQFNEKAEIEQIAQAINNSELAVACHLRTDQWGRLALMGYAMGAHLGVATELPNANDDTINERVTQLLTAAKVQAALHAQFAAPSQTQCKTLGSSKAMTEMDAAAKLGLLFNSVNSR